MEAKSLISMKAAVGACSQNDSTVFRVILHLDLFPKHKS